MSIEATNSGEKPIDTKEIAEAMRVAYARDVAKRRSIAELCLEERNICGYAKIYRTICEQAYQSAQLGGWHVAFADGRMKIGSIELLIPQHVINALLDPITGFDVYWETCKIKTGWFRSYKRKFLVVSWEHAQA